MRNAHRNKRRQGKWLKAKKIEIKTITKKKKISVSPVKDTRYWL